MASRQFFEPMDEVLRPLEMANRAGAQGFAQPQVIIPPGWNNQQGLLGNLAETFSNSMQQQQGQLRQKAAIEGLKSFWPAMQAMGADENQINALLAGGKSPGDIAQYFLGKQSELTMKQYEWAHELNTHRLEFMEKNFTPDQLEAIEEYTNSKGKMPLSEAMRKGKFETKDQLKNAIDSETAGASLLEKPFTQAKKVLDSQKTALEIKHLEQTIKNARTPEERDKAIIERDTKIHQLNAQWDIENKPEKETTRLNKDLQNVQYTLQGLATTQAQYSQALKNGFQSKDPAQSNYIRPPKKDVLDEIGGVAKKGETPEQYMKNAIMPALKKKQLQSTPKSQGSIPSTPIGNMAQKAASKWGIDPDLFGKLVRQESGWNNNARSPVGAIGLTQLMPETAKSLKVNADDPEQNLQGGARYLRSLIDRYKDTKLALVAYNGGDGAVRAWQAGHPYKESIGYVNAILGQEQAQPMKASIPRYVNKKSIEDIWSK